MESHQTSIRHQKSWKKCHYFQFFLSSFTFGKYAELFIFRICSQTVVKTLQKTTQTTTQTSSQTGSQTSSQRIVELIRENNKITTQAMADALGISRRAISKASAKLQAQGVLRRVGGDFGGH